jgi:hypothetical protein
MFRFEPDCSTGGRNTNPGSGSNPGSGNQPRHPPWSSHRRAGRSYPVREGTRREQDHSSGTSPDGLPRYGLSYRDVDELLAKGVSRSIT